MKYQIGEIVRHIKSGREYRIVGTPHRYRIESSGEPAYAYANSVTGEIWVRAQAEMEDGRFMPSKL